jgi:uncharacterized membrane protein
MLADPDYALAEESRKLRSADKKLRRLQMTDSALLLWVRAFHIIALVCWFAGIFIPSTVRQPCDDEDDAVKAQLTVMEHKLYRFVTPLRG